jgi:hypothetical protein
MQVLVVSSLASVHAFLYDLSQFADVMAERMHHIWQPRKSVQELLTFVRHLQVDLECCYGTMIVAMMYMQRLRHKFEAAKVCVALPRYVSYRVKRASAIS